MHAHCALALGSNLGDRFANIAKAINLLKADTHVSNVLVGPMIETQAVRVSALDPGGSFVNTALTCFTSRSPHKLLALCKHIEQTMGPHAHGGPRIIDIDLLLYGTRIMHTPTLTLPHPSLTARRFALEPLAAIAPTWIIPAADSSTPVTVQEHLALLA
jgi:2-amino-4-hydroxy-6-hydroxymethyldihydropteridine diphosphokinase